MLAAAARVCEGTWRPVVAVHALVKRNDSRSLQHAYADTATDFLYERAANFEEVIEAPMRIVVNHLGKIYSRRDDCVYS